MSLAQISSFTFLMQFLTCDILMRSAYDVQAEVCYRFELQMFAIADVMCLPGTNRWHQFALRIISPRHPSNT